MEFGIPHHHHRQKGFLIFVSARGNPCCIKKNWGRQTTRSWVFRYSLRWRKKKCRFSSFSKGKCFELRLQTFESECECHKQRQLGKKRKRKKKRISVWLPEKALRNLFSNEIIWLIRFGLTSNLRATVITFSG